MLLLQLVHTCTYTNKGTRSRNTIAGLEQIRPHSRLSAISQPLCYKLDDISVDLLNIVGLCRQVLQAVLIPVVYRP